MKKLFLKSITVGCAVCIFLSAILVFVMQIAASNGNGAKTCDARLADAVSKLEESKVTISELSADLDAEYISKANAFAEMIKLNPTIIEDADELENIRKILGVDELHVTDDKAVIYWGTVPDYFGFDFTTSEQTKPFLPILEDDTLEIAQEPQPNGTEGKLFQYISVPRRDSKGIVQIGMSPTRLTEALSDSQPQVILGDLKVGTEGSVFAINKTDMTVAAIFDDSLIGKTASEAGIDEAFLLSGSNKGTSFTINGTSYIAKVTQTDDYYVGAIIPFSEILGGAVGISIGTFLVVSVGLAFICFMVLRFLTKNVIAGLNETGKTVKAIGDGNYALRADIRHCEEFSVLSDGINDMASHIEHNVNSATSLNTSMEELIGRIANISESINVYSNEMEDVSQKLSEGSTTQAATVEELSATLASISKEVNDNANAAKNANDIAEESTAQLRFNAEKVKEMQQSMNRISEASQKIGDIVKTIDDIAFQTNILALNASVEAARAGEHGKGFAVVADEVRNLANKSAEAAKVTTELIGDTVSAVEQGIAIANETAEGISSTTVSIGRSAELISEIARATIKQAKSIDEAADGMNQISEVVQLNTGISFNAQETARKLDREAEKLLDMVNSGQ